MESKERMIEIIAESTGESYEKVKSQISILTNIVTNSSKAGVSIEEFKQAVERAHLPKRRKNSNYTKPRNRKKKSKY